MPGSLLDTNIWIASIFTTHPFHHRARQFLRQAKPDEPAIFCRATQQSFLRLASTPAILKAYGAEGMSNRDALLALGNLQSVPNVRERDEPQGTVALWHHFATRDTASPKLWMDAYLGAFAITAGLRMITLDKDFKEFTSAGLELLLLDSITEG